MQAKHLDLKQHYSEQLERSLSPPSRATKYLSHPSNGAFCLYLILQTVCFAYISYLKRCDFLCLERGGGQTVRDMKQHYSEQLERSLSPPLPRHQVRRPQPQIAAERGGDSLQGFQRLLY